MGSFKKKLLSLTVLTFAGGMLFSTFNYSSAEITCPAELSIVSTKNALIAVKGISNVEVTQGNLAKGSITIKNNMGEAIDVDLFFEDYTSLDGVTIINIANAEDEYFHSGETNSLPFKVTATTDAEVGQEQVEVIIDVQWDGGRAEIFDSLVVTVKESPETQANEAGLNGELNAPQETVENKVEEQDEQSPEDNNNMSIPQDSGEEQGNPKDESRLDENTESTNEAGKEQENEDKNEEDSSQNIEGNEEKVSDESGENEGAKEISGGEEVKETPEDDTGKSEGMN